MDNNGLNEFGNNMNNNNNNSMNNNNMNNNDNNSMNNNNSNNKKDFLKKKKVPIIIAGVIIVIIVLFLITKCTGGSNNIKNGSKNGYTAKVGETLKVRQIGGSFDLNVTSSLEKYSSKEILYTGDFIKLSVSIKNNDLTNFTGMISTKYSLVDSSKNEIASSISFASFPNIISKLKLEENQSGTAIIYFEDTTVNKKDEEDYYIDSSTISKAKYLKVSVIAYTDDKELEKGNLVADYEDYYIELK